MIRQGQSAVRTQTRARILLLSDRSRGQKRRDEDVASAMMCSLSTVRNVRRRYVQEGLQTALHDKPRPGQKPIFTGETEAQLAMLACSQPPAGASRWTLRLLAERMIELEYVEYISHVSVGALLKKTHYSLGG